MIWSLKYVITNTYIRRVRQYVHFKTWIAFFSEKMKVKNNKLKIFI